MRSPIRQGDVLLVPVDEPAGKVERIQAQGLEVPGEHSGHVHRLAARVYDAPGGELLFLERPTPLETYHAETGEAWPDRHDTVEVPAGWWRPVPQTEYQPRAVRRRSAVD